MLMGEDEELQILTADLDKLMSLPPGTPPHEGVSQWMLEAISEHGQREREITEAREKVTMGKMM